MQSHITDKLVADNAALEEAVSLLFRSLKEEREASCTASRIRADALLKVVEQLARSIPYKPHQPFEKAVIATLVAWSAESVARQQTYEGAALPVSDARYTAHYLALKEL